MYFFCVEYFEHAAARRVLAEAVYQNGVAVSARVPLPFMESSLGYCPHRHLSRHPSCDWDRARSLLAHIRWPEVPESFLPFSTISSGFALLAECRKCLRVKRQTPMLSVRHWPQVPPMHASSLPYPSIHWKPCPCRRSLHLIQRWFSQAVVLPLSTRSWHSQQSGLAILCIHCDCSSQAI